MKFIRVERDERRLSMTQLLACGRCGRPYRVIGHSSGGSFKWPEPALTLMTGADDDKEFPFSQPTAKVHEAADKCGTRYQVKPYRSRWCRLGMETKTSSFNKCPNLRNVWFCWSTEKPEMRMITVHCVGFSCSRMSGRVALLVVAVAAILFSVQSQRVVTRTMTVTETSTEVRMSTTRMLCAKMVNATGFCRRRRGKWLVEPLVLTFDEDMDVVDRLLDPTLPVM